MCCRRAPGSTGGERRGGARDGSVLPRLLPWLGRGGSILYLQGERTFSWLDLRPQVGAIHFLSPPICTYCCSIEGREGKTHYPSRHVVFAVGMDRRKTKQERGSIDRMRSTRGTRNASCSILSHARSGDPLTLYATASGSPLTNSGLSILQKMERCLSVTSGAETTFTASSRRTWRWEGAKI